MIDKHFKNIIVIALIIMSIISSTIILFTNDNMYSFCLILLPIGYSILLLFYQLLTKHKPIYVGSFIIIASYFMRMVLTPVAISISNYLVIKDVNIIYDQAIIFMLYEALCVFVILGLITKKNNDKEQKNENNFKNVFSKKLLVFISFLSIITLCCIFIYPQILKGFKVGILSSRELIEWQIAYNAAKESMPKLIFYLANWSIIILKEFLTFYLLIIIKNSKKIKKKLLLSIIIIGINLIITDDTLAQSIYFALIYFSILMEMYPKKRRKIFMLLCISVLSIFVLGMVAINSNNNKNFSYKLANTMQVYFSGIYNNAMAFELQRENIPELITGDFLTSLPLIKKFYIELNTSNKVFCLSLGDVYNSQILPTLGQSRLYFGNFLSPILSIIFAALTAFYEKKIQRKDNYFKEFIYYIVVIKCACVPVLYNYSIFLSGLFNLIIPMLLLNILNGGKKSDT